VVLGALTLGEMASPADLLALYLSFNVGLYGGIYTLNAISDAEDDKCDAAKCHRPIPSGDVSVRGAAIFVAISWFFAFGSVVIWFGSMAKKLAFVYTAFIVINLLYSFVLKRVKYMRFITAATTSPLRLYMGGALAGVVVPWTAMLIAYCFMASVQSTKVRTEKGLQNEICNGWSPMVLEAICMAITAVCFLVHYPGDQLFLAAAGISVVLFLGASNANPKMAKVLVGADISDSAKKLA